MDSELKNDVKKEVISWVKVILFAVIFAAVVNNVIIVNAKVPSASMENTIMTDDRVIAFRLAYLFSSPERFDIVVFPAPDDPKTPYVKRIIGMPGETVKIIEGKVYINGKEQPLTDSFVKDSVFGDFGPYEVPEGHYFMLGDNRENSRDSRYWNHKFVAEEDISGKVLFKYFPGFKLLAQKYEAEPKPE